MRNFLKLKPLYIWKVSHEIPKGDGFVKGVHYIIVPSRDVDFIMKNLKVEQWYIKDMGVTSLELLDQASNLLCYTPVDNCHPTELNSLQFYDPGTDRFETFDRSE
jgi:hypothetical protein